MKDDIDTNPSAASPNGSWLAFHEVRASRALAMMAVGAILGLVVAGFGLFKTAGENRGGVPPEDVALVNQRSILQSDFIAQTELQFGTPYAQTTSAQRRKVLDDMIVEELLVQRGLEVELPSMDPDVREALVAGVNLQATADVVAQSPTDAQLVAYFDRNKARYASDGVMRLTDFVVVAPDGQGAARAAVAALRQGRAAEAARLGLEDTRLIDQEDQFDFAVKAKLGETLFQVARKMSVGDVSEPIVTGGKIHVLVMRARRPPADQPYEAVAAKVYGDFKKDAETRVKAQTHTYLRSRAEILYAPGYGR